MKHIFSAIAVPCILVSCSQPSEPPSPETTAEIIVSVSQALGDLPEIEDRPTISHVRIVDLDEDGLQDVLVCDVLGQKVSWIRQEAGGTFTEQTILSEVNGPVHVEAIDMDEDGDLDVLVSAMGVILPSDAHLGEVLILENDGNELFIQHVIAKGVQRVTDVQAGDLDGDGDLDLSVAQFGYTQGQVQWFQNNGDWSFTPHQLIDRSGAIHAPVVDIDNDGDLDVLALLSQEWETVYAFVNDGSGSFTPKILHDVADADFSSSGIEVADLDQDGDADVLWTNGDAFVAIDYRPLPTHGLQWLENHGEGEFEFHRIGQMDGAYAPSVADMDNDGDLDIVTVAEFAFWDRPDTRSVVWWEQLDDMQFAPHTIAKDPTHLVTCDVADLDGNGFPDIVAGGMALYPPFDRITRVTCWMNDGALNEVDAMSFEYPESVQSKLSEASTSGSRGMILHANGFDPRSEYSAAMESEPSNPLWPYYLGILDGSVGDSFSAFARFELAESLDNSYAPLQTRLGELLVGQGEVTLAQQKFRTANTEHSRVALAQIEASNQNWEKLLEILEGSTIPAATSLRLNAQAKLQGETVQPYVAIDMGYQMDDPWLAEVDALCVLAPHLVTQAQTKLIAGNTVEAERLLRRAIEIDGADKDARLVLANILMRGDRLNSQTLTESITHLEASLKSDPEYVMTRSKYGWALYLAQRLNEAHAVWLSILEDEPMHGPALTYLGQLALNQQQFQPAYEYYRLALSVPEDSPFAIANSDEMRASILYRFSLAAIQVNKKVEAMNALKLAVEYTPSDPSIQFELGNMFIGMQQFDQALPHIELANALQPDNARMLAALGYTWFNLNNTLNAMVFLEQAVKLAPTFALAWYHLGNAQQLQGDTNAARESFTMAVQLQPSFTIAKEALSKLR